MNKYFNRLEYGRRLLYEPLKRRYSNEDIKAMLGFLITGMGFTEIMAKNKVVQKLSMIGSRYSSKALNKHVLTLAKQVVVENYDDVAPISITKSEVDSIMKAKTVPEQKILFVYLCYLKYRQNLDGNESDFYVSVPRQAFIDNVGSYCTGEKLNKLVFGLRAQGFLANKVGFTDTKAVLFENHYSETVLELSDLRGLGVIWTAFSNPSYMHHKVLKKCVCCDTPFIDSATKNNKLYCSKCRILPQYREKSGENEKS